MQTTQEPSTDEEQACAYMCTHIFQGEKVVTSVIFTMLSETA